MLCSLLLAAIAKAGNTTYSMTEYQCVALATIDGKWTTADEWDDGPVMVMSDNASFTYNIDMTPLTIQWLVEIFSDNTTDAGDYWQICFDPDNSGGTAPQAGDFMIKIVGHTNLELYVGNGTGWDLTSETGAGEITWADSISDSTWNSTAHWILEFSDIDKTSGFIQTPQPANGMRVAVYDANSSTLASWAPDSNADVPDEWGVIANMSQTPIPEGFSLGVVVLLSSVAVAVSFYFLRKRPKTHSSAKTGEINYTR